MTLKSHRTRSGHTVTLAIRHSPTLYVVTVTNGTTLGRSLWPFTSRADAESTFAREMAFWSL